MQKNRKELVKNITLPGVMASLYVVFVILFAVFVAVLFTANRTVTVNKAQNTHVDHFQLA